MQDALREADELEQRGRYKEAIEKLESKVREGNKAAELFYRLALLKQKTGNINGALSDFQSAGRLDPLDKTIFYNRGVLLYKSGELKDAEEEFRKAVELDSGYVEAVYGLGLVASDLGNKEKAVDYFQSCLIYDPGFTKAEKKIAELSGEQKRSVQSADAVNSPDGRKTVAVMELFYHWDYFITTVNLLQKDFNISLIISSSFKDHLLKNYNFNLNDYNHLVIDRINFNVISGFLKDLKAEALFINTIQGYEVTNAFANFVPPVPLYLTVHNFDLWLGLRPIADPSQPGAKQVNETYKTSCKKIIESCAGLVTIDQNVKEFVSKKIKNKPVYVIPWVTNNSKVKPKKIASLKDPITFTIPASIDRGRRNYGVALEAVKRTGRGFPNLSLVLLGRPVGEYGKEIIKKSRDINKFLGREAVVFFTEYVHQEVYQEYLERSDFFILPLENLHIFGKYKASAAMYDALVQGRPLLIPEEMNFSLEFAEEYGDGFVVYDDLSETIREIMNSPIDQINNFQKSAAENANRFFIENQRKLIKETIFAG